MNLVLFARLLAGVKINACLSRLYSKFNKLIAEVMIDFRPETEEEKNLKEEIKLLKQEKSCDEQTGMNDVILQKEQELELLVRQLDDKIRYSQKNFERPGSGAGRGSSGERPNSRSGTYEDSRPPSRSGAYDDPRPPSRSEDPRFERRLGPYEEPRGGSFSQESERPRSRGSVNSWTRPSYDRRDTQGGGGRGFFASRDSDRYCISFSHSDLKFHLPIGPI